MIVSQPRGLALVTMQDYATFGRMAANSSFVPKDFRGRPEDCALAAQYGGELGLGPMQSLQCIAVVNGRPTVWGDMALALVRGSSVCLGVEEGVEGEGDARAAYCHVHRKGEKPQRRTFSVADAKRAKLWGKTGPWTDYPDRMLQMRARGFALRDVFPDVLRGIVTREEAADYQTVEQAAPRPVNPEKSGGLAVYHVQSFIPSSKTVDPDDDFERFQATADTATEAVASVETTPKARGLVARAKGAIEKAATLSEIDENRRKIDTHLEAGRLTADEAGELITLCHKRAEVVIAAEEQAAKEVAE
jgi:hypothetical protein